MKSRALFFFMLTAGSLLRAQLPTGANVVAGDVNVAQAANAMTVTQASRNAIVNWQSFNLGADATFRLQQAGADAAMLARVVGNDPSKLMGSLKADGKLFLINPKGIVVGQGAVIDTAAFLASTLDVSDDNFLRGGELAFQGDSAAGVVNYGKITAREGNVFLFAHTVKNAGELNAAKGTVGLGAGTEVLLASPDAAGFVIKTNLPTTAEKVGMENSGVIAAAQAQLEAAGGSIYDLAVNQSGVVRATGSEIRNGRVLLTANGGTVGASGEITARNRDGSGGEILIGGDYRGQNSAVANAARTVVTATAKLDASAATDAAKAGRVIVWADNATRFLGTLSATGAGGGFAEVSGKRYLDFNPRSVVQLGTGGTLLLDPDALVISDDPNDGTSTSGTNPFTFGATTEPATLNVTTLQNQLAASNVILDTSTSTGDITFNAAVSWANGHALTVRSGNNINLNADITGGTGSTLALYTGRRSEHFSGGESGAPIRGEAELDSDATIKVGTLIYGANAQSNPGPEYTMETPANAGNFFIYGNIDVTALEVDLSAGEVGLSTEGTHNAIGAFRTTGNGVLRSAYIVDHEGDLDVTVKSSGNENAYLQFLTSGTLTLEAGSAVDFAAPGTVILASKNGAFINQAGANVFNADTRFLIYSNTTSATQKGGLVGTDVFNHAYDENDYFDDGTSRFFFTALSGAPVLTYQADSFTRKYGAANPAFTFTRTGLVNDVADDVTGAPALSATVTQSSGVGAYAINIGLGTLASNNYDFDFVNGTLTVEKAPLTVTANDKTRRINLDNPVFDARFSGFVLGETQAALGGTLSFATDAAQASSAGNYAISPSGLASSNYAISFLPGTLTLTTTSALLITANNFDRTYGAANPTFTANYSGFVGNETESIVSGLQFSTLAMQSSGVGTYTITPFGATAIGYDITYAPGTITIDRASLTISVPNQSRTYGAANNLVVNYNGLVNGDTSSAVTGLSLATSATPTSNVGTYAITASGAAAANYSILYAQGSLSVTPAPITVTLNHSTRRYGDADPAFTFSIGGLQNGDSESLINVGTISSLANATAGIGSYGLVAFPWTTSANYSVPTQVAGSMTITPRPLTITANNFTRVYGDANPPFTATFDGLASFDTPALFGNIGLTTQATQSSGVGNWGITFQTVANANYAITSQSGTLAITPAPLTFLPLVELSRVYGRANPSLVLPEVSGLKLSDTVANLGLAFDAPALTANVGTYAYSLTTTNQNYSLETGVTGEFRVTPAPLTVAIGSAGRVYGDATPINYDLRVTGLAFDDAASSVAGVFDPTEARTDVGTYTIESRLLDTNYFINSATNGSLVISPRMLTLTAADRTRIYGDINPFFFGSITGFLSGDSELNIITNLGYVTNATQASSVGNYWIRPSAQTTTANYIINPVDGTLSITRAPLSVTIANASRTYGQANPTFSAASAQGLKNQDTTASLGLTFSTSATTSSDVGFYTILGQSASANYTVSFDPGVLTINRASAIIAANTASRIFGNLFTSNPFSLTFTGFLAADEVIARGNWQLTFTDDATLAPGGHAIGFNAANVLTTAALSKNYDISLQAGTLNVTARPLTITVPDMKFLLGSVVPATIDFGTPDLPAGSPAFTVVGQRTSADGKTTIVPGIVPGTGVTRAELDRYFTFDLKSGAVSFTFDPQDVDLNHQLRLTLNPNDTPINRDNTTTNETIEVDKPQKLNLTANPYVPFDTQPLTKTDYANYFSSFANTTEAVKTALAGGYTEFLAGKGKSGSAYEGMTEAARQMLADWMSGSVSTADLSALIAAGNADAASAFGFILPTLVDQTRGKNVADMTMMDRQILGRLADLTEKRNTQTILLAQQKYAAMLEANAKKAEMNGLGSILLGPGDFKALVADASNEAITNYITATIGAGGAAGASGVALMSIQSVVTSLFPFASSAATTAASIGGPAIAVSMAVVLAVRATQISESINNENDYNALINSWKVGQEITSLAQLKSPAMNQDLKLSTLMLSAELFSSTP